jgi:hypothetical protein
MFINTTEQLNNYLQLDQIATLEFPANVNLLLNDGLLSDTQIEQVERVASDAGRSLHLRSN